MTALLMANNHADTGGGAFYTDDGTILRNSTLSGNTANLGGGIDSDWSVQADELRHRRQHDHRCR